jgi:tetratricopeptide (TPR) repeat protein
MGDLYFQMGQLDDALAQYKEAIFVKPDFSLSPGKIAYIYALREDYAEAMKWVDYLIATAPSSGVQGGGYLHRAFYNYLLGNYDQTLSILYTAEELLEPAEWEWGISVVDWMRALSYYEQGKLEQSRNYFNDYYVNIDYSYDTLLHDFYVANYNFYLGLIDLKQQTIDSARTRLVLINSLLPTVHSVFKDHALFLHDFLYAEVLFAQDSLEKSITVFENAPKFDVEYAPSSRFTGLHIPYDKDVVARAYYKNGNVDRAITEYLRLLDPDPNKRGRTLIRPRWRYRLAKLYEEKGFRAKAIEQYEKFLDVWKDADADRPELIDARQRLANLRAG